jgi:alpha-N-acetylglucosaminidase
VSAAPDCVGANAFGFDIADVGREYLTIHPAIAAYDCLQTEGFAKGNAAAIKTGGEAAVALLHDLDELLSSQQGFLLGEWLNTSRAMGETAVEKAFYEWNARSQVALRQSPFPFSSVLITSSPSHLLR